MKNENVDTDAIVDLQLQALQRLDTIIPSVSIHSSESRCLAVMSCHVMSFLLRQTNMKHETRNTKQELLLTSHLINLPSQNLEWVSYARCWGMHSLLNLSLPLLKWNMYQYDNMTVVGLLMMSQFPVSRRVWFSVLLFSKKEKQYRTLPYSIKYRTVLYVIRYQSFPSTDHVAINNYYVLFPSLFFSSLFWWHIWISKGRAPK